MEDLEHLQSIIEILNINDDDTIYGVYNPTHNCTECGGFGIKAWLGNRSILCECLHERKDEFISFKLLKKLCLITKDEVYGNND